MEERIKVFLLETGLVLSQEPVSGAGLIRFGFSFFLRLEFRFFCPPSQKYPVYNSQRFFPQPELFHA